MSRGRKASPVEVKKVRGTLRPDRVAPNVVTAIEGGPDFAWVEDPVVLAWAEHITGYLRAENRASKSDELLIELAAKRMAEIRLLDKLISELKPMYWKEAKEGGSWKSLPAVGQRNEAMRHLQSCLSELGLTPASRNRVSAPLQAGADNEWANDGFDAVGLN